jgi:hypothetical protein
LVEKISRTYSSNLEQNQEGAHLEVPFLWRQLSADLEQHQFFQTLDFSHLLLLHHLIPVNAGVEIKDSALVVDRTTTHQSLVVVL